MKETSTSDGYSILHKYYNDELSPNPPFPPLLAKRGEDFDRNLESLSTIHVKNHTYFKNMEYTWNRIVFPNNFALY